MLAGSFSFVESQSPIKVIVGVEFIVLCLFIFLWVYVKGYCTGDY